MTPNLRYYNVIIEITTYNNILLHHYLFFLFLFLFFFSENNIHHYQKYIYIYIYTLDDMENKGTLTGVLRT